MIHKDVCDKGYIWNPSNCESECDKSCGFGEYLDYENCKCKKRLVDKIVDECTETIAYCTLYCFQNSLQLMLELVLILFTINT